MIRRQADVEVGIGGATRTGWRERRVTAGDSRASRVSDAPCLSNQVHFFISSYPCQPLQLADQQSVAVCFNQAAPPLLQTGPDYPERGEKGRDGEGRRAGGRPTEGRGRMSLAAVAEMIGVKRGTCKHKMESRIVANV